MKLAEALKTVREAKNLSQKELAGLVNMAQAQYSRIESSKTDPSFSAVVKIAKALGVSLGELFEADEVFKDVNTYDKTLMEKLRLIEALDEAEKKSIFHIIDMAISKKRLKDNLQNLIALDKPAIEDTTKKQVANMPKKKATVKK